MIVSFRALPLTVLSLLFLAACNGGGGSDPDASADADADGVPPDGSIDARNLCPGELTFTGDYVDWDSTEMDFLGIFEAQVTEVGDPQNTATTAPNGRSILCLPSGEDADVSFEHEDYLPLRFAMDAEAASRQTYTARGLTPARADTLYADELELTRETDQAIVVADVRTAAGPLTGATVALGTGQHDGAFARGEDGTFSAGDAVAAGGAVLFANVAPGGGTTSLTVTPPGGETCHGRAEVPLLAGTITFAQVFCE